MIFDISDKLFEHLEEYVKSGKHTDPTNNACPFFSFSCHKCPMNYLTESRCCVKVENKVQQGYNDHEFAQVLEKFLRVLKNKRN